MILMEKKLLERFTKKIAENKTKKIIIEKVIKRKCYKSYVKWKGYNNLFNN